MKVLSLLMLLACASHHKDDFSPKKPFELAKNMSYEDVVKGKKEPVKCTSLNNEKYCQFEDKSVVHFGKNKAIKEITLKPNPMILNVTMVSLKSQQQEGKVVKFSAAKGSFLEESAEWKEYLPLITKAMQKAGYEVTEDETLAKQHVVLNFGLKTLSTAQVNRFLKMFSYSNSEATGKKGRDLWRIELSSLGSSRDLKRIMPIYAAIAYALLSSDEKVNELRKVSENDLEVIAFQDQAQK